VFGVGDSAGVSHAPGNIGMGANNEALAGPLAPNQSVECCAVVTVPGNVDAQTLTVTCPDGGAPQTLNVAGKTAIRETFARDASAGAAARYTALAEVPASTGAYYPMQDLDCRLDSVAYGARPATGSDTPPNTRCLIATATIRNPLAAAVHCDSETIGATLALSDGTLLQWRGYPLSGQSDMPIAGDVTPAQEVQVRVFFDVPALGVVKPAALRVSERASRVYVYTVAGLQ
ncbi:MAG TPA: hypothetical protein VLT83_17040, partial [Opitutaceae bacterium]|nr:hypothetical protein [Opitutaceae bacterium]